MRFAEMQDENYCIAWCEDGRSFVIRNCDEFTRTVVPKYFKPTKFSSFTRKLYRWGFRQINRGLGPDDPVIFGCAHFQRDAPEEMANMRSVTAAGTRKDVFPVDHQVVAAGTAHPHHHPMMQQQQQQQHVGAKRSLDEAFYQEESLQKRLLLSKLLQQQTMMQQQHHHQSQSNPLFANVNPNSALAMASMQHQSAAHNYHHAPQYHPHHHMEAAQNSLKPAAYHHYMGQQQGGAGHHQQAQYHHQQPMMGSPNGTTTTNGGYSGEPARTAEIVNAAIAALRNA